MPDNFGTLVLLITKEDPFPLAPNDSENGRIGYVVNELNNNFAFGDDIVPPCKALEYVCYKGKWHSTRKMQSYLDLGLEGMMQKYREMTNNRRAAKDTNN